MTGVGVEGQQLAHDQPADDRNPERAAQFRHPIISGLAFCAGPSPACGAVSALIIFQPGAAPSLALEGHRGRHGPLDDRALRSWPECFLTVIA
jgi:hypothetical protein